MSEGVSDISPSTTDGGETVRRRRLVLLRPGVMVVGQVVKIRRSRVCG